MSNRTNDDRSAIIVIMQRSPNCSGQARHPNRIGIMRWHSGLMVHKVPFIVCELEADVDPFMLHIYAAVAQKERSLIADRTREALKAAKDRGQRLGNPRLDEVRHLAAAATREAADRFAENTLPIVRQIQASGVTALRAIAVALAARGIPTAGGGAWNAMQVSNCLRTCA
jgi:hypothetical protein